MKILVIKVSALGDVVHALAVLDYLQSTGTQVDIDWLVEAPFAPLLDDHSGIRKVHRLDTKTWRKNGPLEAWRAARKVLAALRAEHYDLVLDLQGNSKSGFFTLFSGAPRRYGFARGAVREWPNLLATTAKVALQPTEHHIIDRSLAIAKAAVPGGTVPLCGKLPVGDAERESVEKRLLELNFSGPLVVCHYGTTWVTKHWPLSSWMELCGRLVDELGIRPLLTWGNDAEFRAAQELSEATGGRALIWPRGSLRELVALLARADLVVGADTGPIHIASVVGTPTISLFRVTDAERNGPRGAEHIRLQSPLDCSPCLRKNCGRDDECGRSITVAAVWSAIRGQLS